MTAPKHTPAFPVADPFALEPANAMEMKRIASGMALRDYMATKALQGLLAMQANNTYGTQFEPFRWSNPDHVEGIAEGAYLLADAMLRAREA